MDWAAYEPGLHAQLKEIKSLQEPEQSLAFVLSQGAGLAVLDNGPQVSTFAEDGCVAAFTGILHNMHTIQGLLQRLEASKSRFSAPVESASRSHETREPLAICQLYRSLGPAMVAKLQGDFAFVLHDSRLGQTLAACSAGTAGAAPYLQYAVTEDDHLVVTGGSQGGQSSGKFSRHRLRLPKAWGSLQEVRLNHYIYGQDGRVQQFAFLPEDVVEEAVAVPNAGSSPTQEAGGLAEAAALDASGVVKKTRRGKRAGRNLKERASFESHRASMDSRRSSLDERGSLDLPQPGRFSTDSQRPSLDGYQAGDNSRADSDRWWRRSTDTSAPTSPARERPGGGQMGGGNPVHARRTCSLPDPMAMAPPRDLTIPEHPDESSRAAPGHCNLQARAAPTGRAQEAGRAYYGHAGPPGRPGSSGSAGAQGPLFRGAGQGPPAGSAGQPRRGFGSGASAPLRAPATAAAAAAAALRAAHSQRSSADGLGRHSADMASVRSSLERQSRSNNGRERSAACAEKASDGQELPPLMRSGSGPLDSLPAPKPETAKPIGPL
ncbi:g11963 [Coccomyxa viridis]|uniref:G11963 protein n=1 Tax=Coccomyxa viridis TaxID=1274662 RepID=A0ABP1GEU2_9CHLO